MKKWDKVYSKKFGGVWYPNEGVIRFVARFIKRRVGINIYESKKKVEKILDVGCGNGRHVIFFAKQGFDVYGFDISKEAMNIAKAWLSKEGLKAHLLVSDVGKLPFRGHHFDLVISCETLDHISFLKAKKTIKEIKKALVPGGYLFITLRSTESSEYGRGERVDKNTFKLKEGYEKGLFQHYFDLKEIKELLRGFKIFDIELHEQKFPSIYTLDKAFLQSSTGMKKYLDLKKPIDFNYCSPSR